MPVPRWRRRRRRRTAGHRPPRRPPGTHPVRRRRPASLGRPCRGHTPRLLLLDEPFAALDETGRSRLIADVRDLLSTHQITTLHVTHDRREAAALAHRIVVLDHGRIRADGTTGDVLNDPAVATHIGGDRLLDDALAAHLHDRPESTLDTD